jgi:phosphohistidine phosphatase SixA
MDCRHRAIAGGLAWSLVSGFAWPAQAAHARPTQAAEALVPADVLRQMRAGGCVLLMRHARSPRESPTRAEARPDNHALERQLDAEGRAGAAAMGDALRRLGIATGTVLTSPAYRAVETVRLAGLMSYTAVEPLGDGGQSMQPVTEAQAAWLRARVAEVPSSGNVLIVTHQPNLTRAFPEWGGSVADGETVVLRPDGRGGATVIGRISIETWPRLR